MRIFTLDFETYFDDEYTLEKLTTEAYIRDERFEAHGAAVYERGAEAATWHTPRTLKELLESWQASREKICLIAHHAHFDGLILSYHFDYRPHFWLDTLSMGRVCFDSGVKLGLDSLATRFQLSPKTMPYAAMKGRHWDSMSSMLRLEIATGSCHDCRLTDRIASEMLGGSSVVPYPFPVSELPVVDLTVRMFTEPCLVGDIELLAQAWYDERRRRDELLSELGCTAKDLRNDNMFAAMLEQLGIEPEEKVTESGNVKYAFAKSDYFMQDLAASADCDVADLAEARLLSASSIYRTRVERIGEAAKRGPLPVYLVYCAAHTRRWGGGDKMNWQNFPRPDPAKPQKGALRRAIKAP